MISETNKRGIRQAYSDYKKALNVLRKAREDLRFELKAARLDPEHKASFSELGLLLGVSRQYIHRMLKDERTV